VIASLPEGPGTSAAEQSARVPAAFLLGLFVFAFALRFGATLALRDLQATPTALLTGADGVEYNFLALQMARGHGFAWESGELTSFRAPGLSLFLACFYVLTGPYYPLIYVIFALLGAFSCVLTYFLAAELLPENASRWAAMLAALYVPHIYFATRFDSENLITPLLAACLWLFLRHLRTASLGSLAVAGLCLGASILTRPFAQLLVPLLVLVQVVAVWRSPFRALVPTVIFLLTTLAIVLPWTVRNYAVHGHLVAVATNGGSTFYGSNNDVVLHDPEHLGGWVSTTMLPGRAEVEATPDEISHDKLEWQLGRTWVRENVTALPVLVFHKLLRFSLPDTYSSNRQYVWLQVVGTTPFLILIALGMMRCVWQRAYWTLPWLTVHVTLLATVVTVLIFWGSPRFRDANAPLLMLYAVVGLGPLTGWWRHAIEPPVS